MDGTGGLGGHSKEIIRRLSKTGRLITLDLDITAVKAMQEKAAKYPNWTVKQGNFSRVKELVVSAGGEKFDGIILDLGISSFALEDGERGLSYKEEGPLDLRFDREGNIVTGLMVLEQSSEKELTDILRKYGEVTTAGRIARSIKTERPQTTVQLARIVERFAGRAKREKLLSQVFQALRIKVNRELENLAEFLEDLPDCLKPGGRAAVISFHSLEDRMVKEFFLRESKDCLCPAEYPVCVCGHKAKFWILTKKAVRPSAGEIAANVRGRSAKLRCVEAI